MVVVRVVGWCGGVCGVVVWLCGCGVVVVWWCGCVGACACVCVCACMCVRVCTTYLPGSSTKHLILGNRRARGCVAPHCDDALCATKLSLARLAQSAERKALNLVVVGSSPTVGEFHGARLLSFMTQS